MKCPNCGFQIVDGYLYCENCGMEIRMVPDFEPEIEYNITQALSGVAEEIGGDGTILGKGSLGRKKTLTPLLGQKERKAEKKKRRLSAKGQGKNWLIASLVTFTAGLIAAAFVVVSMYHRYSVDYQIKKAEGYAALKDYERGIFHLENARRLREDADDILLLEASYYYQMGKKEEAVELLAGLVQKQQLAYEDRVRAYENLISIYSEDGRFEEINALLASCKDEGILGHFQQYTAKAPLFDHRPGEYDEVILLKMDANTNGKIYYTMDGSAPDEHSKAYTIPLLLESGEYQIAAVFVNEYGIKSEVSRGWYKINYTVPEPPQVFPDSGDHHVPTMIRVSVPEGVKVYYTTDGSEPGLESALYTQPIPMPLGKSNFMFVAVSEDEVLSEVASRSFDLTLETEITVDRAIDNVIKALFDQRVLSDMLGNSLGMQGKYVFQYDTIVEIPDLGYYYILKEYIEDASGGRTETGHLYAVEVYTGAPNRLTYDENGQMGLIPLT